MPVAETQHIDSGGIFALLDMSRPVVMRFLVARGATQAEAEDIVQDLIVKSGPLGPAIITFGEQAGVNIGLTDPQLAMSVTRGVKGRYDVAHALRLLLRGTGADFETVAPRTIRIVKAHFERSPPAPRSQATPPPPAAPSDDIIVTASKQLTPLSSFPGTATVIGLTGNNASAAAPRGTGAIVELLPVLAATNLGPGRNKVFIRGIADSSFNGTSPSTTGLYLGDARLTYNSPDPSLNLFDMRQVEVIEGPQGTLYGNGAIGDDTAASVNLPIRGDNRTDQ